jgi:hypothetical protein
VLLPLAHLPRRHVEVHGLALHAFDGAVGQAPARDRSRAGVPRCRAARCARRRRAQRGAGGEVAVIAARPLAPRRAVNANARAQNCRTRLARTSIVSSRVLTVVFLPNGAKRNVGIAIGLHGPGPTRSW